MNYELTVWLEIHLKLKSPNKLFCKCPNSQDFDNLLPNSNICPVCTAQPWALPVLNEEPLKLALKLWKALNCKIQRVSTFDRKSYFYPDLPSWYQITQYYNPVNIKGQVNFFVDKDYSKIKTVRIHDAHIETDTWKTIHIEWQTLLDFNRAWTPLIEIVTEPDFHDAEEVVEFLKELQRIARYNWISDADMEKWQMRVDVNISIKKPEDKQLWTRVELKNINSFGAIKRAIINEYNRQKQQLDLWNEIFQETRRREDLKWESFVMRSKENALDYRYFPEPDLPKLELSNEILSWLDWQQIVSPFEIIKNMKQNWEFHKEYINALIHDKQVLDYFFEVFDKLKKIIDKDDKLLAKQIAKWISGQISFWLKENYKTIAKLLFDQEQFIDFLKICLENKIQTNQLKIVMEEMLQTWKSAKDIISQKWFDQDVLSEEDLKNIAKQVLSENPWIVNQYKWWKTTTIGFFVGQVMKKTQWKANPQQAKQILENLLKE